MAERWPWPSEVRTLTAVPRCSMLPCLVHLLVSRSAQRSRGPSLHPMLHGSMVPSAVLLAAETAEEPASGFPGTSVLASLSDALGCRRLPVSAMAGRATDTAACALEWPAEKVELSLRP